MMIMMRPAEDSISCLAEIEALPLFLNREEMAVLLRSTERSIRRWHTLGTIPKNVNGTWYKPEILAWIDAGRPHRQTWEQLKPKRFKNK